MNVLICRRGTRLRAVKELAHSHTDDCVGEKGWSPGVPVTKPGCPFYHEVSLGNSFRRIKVVAENRSYVVGGHHAFGAGPEAERDQSGL